MAALLSDPWEVITKNKETRTKKRFCLGKSYICQYPIINVLSIKQLLNNTTKSRSNEPASNGNPPITGDINRFLEKFKKKFLY